MRSCLAATAAIWRTSPRSTTSRPVSVPSPAHQAAHRRGETVKGINFFTPSITPCCTRYKTRASTSPASAAPPAPAALPTLSRSPLTAASPASRISASSSESLEPTAITSPAFAARLPQTLPRYSTVSSPRSHNLLRKPICCCPLYTDTNGAILGEMTFKVYLPQVPSHDVTPHSRVVLALCSGRLIRPNVVK